MRIDDPRAIKALAHPLRLDLLELVGRIGPVTAARCGRVLDVPQANCSFHLRQLAKYGFVEEAAAGPDRRERRWRITELRLRFGGPEADPVVTQQFGRVVLEREAARIRDHIERSPGEPEDWRAAASMVSATIPLTVEDLAVIKERWREVLAPYTDAFEASGGRLQPGQRYVRFFSAASPLPDIEQEGPDDGTED